MSTTKDVTCWVEQRLDADDTVTTEVGLLVLAALSGAEELDDYLATGAEIEPDEPDPQSGVKAATGAFLGQVVVQGFRGIGAPVTLDLLPTPGLTVVAGRNGSGKSSLAEAVELMLTGGTYRWKNKRSTQWADHWRNLHVNTEPEIRAVIVEEGSGSIRLRTRWEAGEEDVRDHTTTAQRVTGQTLGPAADASSLGWAGALDTYRPMLSYDELGGLLEAGPSELYDALAKVLGTERLADALTRLKSRRDSLGAPGKTLAAERKQLKSQAAALADDERAQAVAGLLGKTAPDVDAVRELATGVAKPDGGTVDALRALTHLTGPELERTRMAAARLRAAVAAMAEAGEQEAARQLARTEVLRHALTLYAEHGDQSCPVCSRGSLDVGWAETSRSLVEQTDKQLRVLADARAELSAARVATRTLVTPVPSALDRAPVPDLDAAVSEARRAWAEMSQVPSSDLALSDHVELWAGEVGAALEGVRALAAGALQERDDAWAPTAARIAAWCEGWKDWLGVKAQVDDLTNALTWLQTNDIRLKNELMAPISERAKRAWSLLKQDSNVEIGDLRLEGQANRRRVAISATIDGQEAGGALPVMSQGELHALTLALFLPRASLDESPFRFIVLDDPVQAMDPAKIDGLVTLLTELAETRQVVVFSHDDRLPAALRRSGSAARILEVTRGLESAVEVTAADDPSERYLRDARALTKDGGLPDAALRRTLPGLLRMAIESAARDRFFAARLLRGDPLHEVEQSWSDAPKTSSRVSLAVYDEVRSLDRWLTTESRKKGLGIATSGFHQSLAPSTDPSDAVHHVGRLVADVRSGVK